MADSNQTTKRKVLFLCTGNSCRSQMAEAITNTYLSNNWQAYSAGTKPAGYVHPLAIVTLEEIGISHKGWSKDASQYSALDFDLVVTVCDSAAEDCPTWLKSGRQVHLSFVDPAKFEGDQDFILDRFRQVRDEIKQKIPQILEEAYSNVENTPSKN
jgi:arsenate reductase